MISGNSGHHVSVMTELGTEGAGNSRYYTGVHSDLMLAPPSTTRVCPVM